jgi:prepilin signal peptidase PulO-like enzyme (type II secretory pathway)
VLAIFPALAFLVLAAHFFRAGDLAFFVVALLFLPLLFVPRRWAARLVEAGLLAGTVVWVRALGEFAGQRRAMGLPYTRLAAILGGVALATAACLLVFRSERARLFFGR